MKKINYLALMLATFFVFACGSPQNATQTTKEEQKIPLFSQTVKEWKTATDAEKQAACEFFFLTTVADKGLEIARVPREYTIKMGSNLKACMEDPTIKKMLIDTLPVINALSGCTKVLQTISEIK